MHQASYLTRGENLTRAPPIELLQRLGDRAAHAGIGPECADVLGEFAEKESCMMPPVSVNLSPVRRAGRLLVLLRESRTLGELRALLGISASQLRVDLRELREEGWLIEETAGRGRAPKRVWLSKTAF